MLTDADPIWRTRGQDANGARRTVWLSEDCIRGYGDHFVQSTDRHPMTELAGHLNDLGLGRARIGVEMGNYCFLAKAMMVLGQALQGAIWEDATGLVNWQRAVKSKAEIAFMRKAAAISQKVVDGLIERVEPGGAKNEVVAEIYRDVIRGVEGALGDYPAIVPLLPSGMMFISCPDWIVDG